MNVADEIRRIKNELKYIKLQLRDVRQGGGGIAAHNILDGAVHLDSVADGVTRGSIIYGNATPKWDELDIGAVDTFLGSNGTDISYRTAAQVLASLSGEAGAAFDWNDQNLTSVGTIALDGGQLAFPAAQNASADPNTQDDYEEGTWTPDLQFGDAKVGITYSHQAGWYTKKGREVSVTGYFVLASKGSSVGAATIEALPFTVANDDAAYAPPNLWIVGVSFANYPQAYAGKNTKIIDLGETTEAGIYTTLQDINFGDASVVMLSVTYFTD